MKCRYCGDDPEVVYIIPEATEDVDLKQSAFCCRKCGLEQGVICQKHEEVHLSFGKSGHACRDCIEETAQGLMSIGHEITDWLTNELDDESFAEVEEWAHLNSQMMQRPLASSFAYAVASSYQILRSSRLDAPLKLDADNFFDNSNFVLESIKHHAYGTV